jgi:hypothetical protein
MVSPEIPLIFSRLIFYLKEHCLEQEGLFRKAGGAARIKELRRMCEEKKGDVDFAKISSRPHDISALLKQFVRYVFVILMISIQTEKRRRTRLPR